MADRKSTQKRLRNSKGKQALPPKRNKHSARIRASPDPVVTLLARLNDLLVTLHVAAVTAKAAALALRHQDAESDKDMAELLEWSICGPLTDQFEKTQSLLDRRTRERRGRAAAREKAG